jgi:hypothetical protein
VVSSGIWTFGGGTHGGAETPGAVLIKPGQGKGEQGAADGVPEQIPRIHRGCWVQ